MAKKDSLLRTLDVTIQAIQVINGGYSNDNSNNHSSSSNDKINNSPPPLPTPLPSSSTNGTDCNSIETMKITINDNSREKQYSLPFKPVLR